LTKINSPVSTPFFAAIGETLVEVAPWQRLRAPAHYDDDVRRKHAVTSSPHHNSE
jgi:hypothetical protein